MPQRLMQPVGQGVGERGEVGFGKDEPQHNPHQSDRTEQSRYRCRQLVAAVLLAGHRDHMPDPGVT